jgi:hypothetical protein
VGIGSQNFEPAMAAFDDQAAHDFMIGGFPAHYVTGVRIMGEYSAGGGPASSFNIYFYQNATGNLPGPIIRSFTNLPYTGTPPDFLICLPAVVFSPSRYLLGFSAGAARLESKRSVVLAQPYGPEKRGRCLAESGDGYGTGCISWNRKNACMADQVWPVQVFQILGFTEGPTPSPKPAPSPRPRPTTLAPRPSP